MQSSSRDVRMLYVVCMYVCSPLAMKFILKPLIGHMITSQAPIHKGSTVQMELFGRTN